LPGRLAFFSRKRAGIAFSFNLTAARLTEHAYGGEPMSTQRTKKMIMVMGCALLLAGVGCMGNASGDSVSGEGSALKGGIPAHGGSKPAHPDAGADDDEGTDEAKGDAGDSDEDADEGVDETTDTDTDTDEAAKPDGGTDEDEAADESADGDEAADESADGDEATDEAAGDGGVGAGMGKGHNKP
jgi:hypothetical protein